MEHSLLKLPLNILKKILNNMSYSDLETLRRVNRFFYENCGPILNAEFLSLQIRIENRLSCLEMKAKAGAKNFNTLFFRYKAFQILSTEFRALFSVCGRYATQGYWCFSAGRILDGFHTILDTQESKDIEHDVIMKLFLTCDEFMEHFENVIEPLILKKCSISSVTLFGTKVIDALECYINLNLHLIVTYDGRFCHLAGKYETVKATSVVAPPEFGDSENGTVSSEDLTILARYLRNNMRWNNFMYWIDVNCCRDQVKMIGKNRKLRKYSLKLPTTRFEEDVTSAGDHFTGNGTVIRKIFKRNLGIRETTEGLSFIVDLQCDKEFAPLRIEPLIFDLNNELNRCMENSGLSEVPEFSNRNSREKHDLLLLTGKYEFSMEMRVKHIVQKWNGEELKESVIQLYQTKDNCIVKVYSSPVTQ